MSRESSIEYLKRKTSHPQKVKFFYKRALYYALDMEYLAVFYLGLIQKAYFH